MARRAQAMVALLHQVDKQFVRRDTDSDGWIGDSAHSTRPSDHNPNKAGVVRAQDFDENDASGGEAVGDWLWRNLLKARDPRTKYVIYEGRMFSSYPAHGYEPWTPRPYSGSNKHLQHLHLSVVDDPKLYDDPRPWFAEQEKSKMVGLKLIRIDGKPAVYVCNGVELQKIGNAEHADAMWPDWRTKVQDVSSKSGLGRLPRRDP